MRVHAEVAFNDRDLDRDHRDRDRDLTVSIERLDGRGPSGDSGPTAVQRTHVRTARLRPFTPLVNEPELYELLDLAIALYTVDRLVRRPANGWSREIELALPVHRVEALSHAADLLRDLCFAATGDLVHLRPIPHTAGALHADRRQATLALEHPHPLTVALLSDGLDSACGAYHALREAPSANDYVFVSVMTNSLRRHRIESVFRELNTTCDAVRTRHHDLTVFLHHDGASEQKHEQSQRFRTFLALTAGLTAAAAYETRRLEVYENGFGLLNLPQPFVQMPHESSRALNPANLSLWDDISERFLNGAQIIYPNRHRTKAQLLASLPAAAHPLIAMTSSCDAPHGSCRFRQFSLATAQLSHCDVRYLNFAPRHRMVDPLDAFFRHAGLLSAVLAAADPWPPLLRLHRSLETAALGEEHRLQPDDPDARDPDAQRSRRAHAVSATIELLRRHTIDMIAWERCIRASA